MEGSMKSLRRAFTGEEEKETDYVRQVTSMYYKGHVPSSSHTYIHVLYTQHISLDIGF